MVIGALSQERSESPGVWCVLYWVGAGSATTIGWVIFAVVLSATRPALAVIVSLPVPVGPGVELTPMVGTAALICAASWIAIASMSCSAPVVLYSMVRPLTVTE